MSEKNHLEEVDNIEIEPLNDEDLESVSGGAGEELSCSRDNCSNSAAN
jgi:bacteriocin-like protein